MPVKLRTVAERAGKARLKSTACEPGMASPIRREAGFLYDQAGLSGTTHRAFRAHRSHNRTLPEPQPAKLRTTTAERAGKTRLKSKACEPGMASPIRREAGFLCDHAGLSGTTHRASRASRAHHSLNRTLPEPQPAKLRTAAERAGKARLKSKACEPGMASPIRREAGLLCDQAGLFCTTHRASRALNRASRPRLTHPPHPAIKTPLKQKTCRYLENRGPEQARKF